MSVETQNFKVLYDFEFFSLTCTYYIYIRHYSENSKRKEYTMNSWKHAGSQIMVQVLVLTHFVDFMPLLFCHLVLDCLCSHIFSRKIFSTETWICSCHTTGQKSQSVRQVTNTKRFQSPYTLNIP